LFAYSWRVVDLCLAEAESNTSMGDGISRVFCGCWSGRLVLYEDENWEETGKIIDPE